MDVEYNTHQLLPIEKFSKDLESLIQENKSLKQLNKLYLGQLLVVYMNNGYKRLDGYKYSSLVGIDHDKLSASIGMTGFSIVKIGDYSPIKKFEDIPKLPTNNG